MGQKKNLGRKKILGKKKNVGLKKKFWLKKIFLVEKKILVKKKFLLKKNFGLKNFQIENCTEFILAFTNGAPYCPVFPTREKKQEQKQEGVHEART